MPFLLFLEGFIINYSDTLEEMKKSIQDMEPNKDGVIREDFLSQDVKRSFERMEQITMAITDEANAVLHSVKDIINVRDIDDGEFLDNVQHAKKMNRQTIEKLHAFDRHNTAKLDPIEQDLRTMKNYISQIRELGNNGKLRIDSYQARQLGDHKFHQELISGIKNKAVRNAIGLEAVLGEAGKLLLYSYSRFAAIPVQYLQKHFGLKTMSYSYRAIHAATAASGDYLTTQQFSTIEHHVISAVEVSDYKKVRQGTYYTLTDGRIIRKFQSESGSVGYELVDTIPENRWRPKKPEKSWLERS
ncbi:T7SS effector LXG polymorphic toxin, partial [Clostridium sp. 1xD42-85]